MDEFEDPPRVLISESHGEEGLINRFCYNNGKNGLNAIFLFKAISTPFKAEHYREMVMTFERHFPEPLIPTLVFANHDRNRIISRLGGSVEKAKLLALFQFTCRGIPFTYFGDEIGIPRVRIPLKQGKDAVAMQHKWVPQFLVDRSVEILNRDECRTPMLWSEKPNAGFCRTLVAYSGKLQENKRRGANRRAPLLLNFYKKVIRFRNKTPALQAGSLEIAHEFCDKRILAYRRILNGEKHMVLLNMSRHIVKSPISSEVLLSTHSRSHAHELQPFEGRVLRETLQETALL